MGTIDCFIPYQDEKELQITIRSLLKSDLVNNVFLLGSNVPNIEGCRLLNMKSLTSTSAIKKIAENITADFCLIYTKETALELGQYALDRYLNVAKDCGAGLTYSDHYQLIGEERKPLPTIDYQLGSVRDDFNFGSVLFYNAKYLKEAVGRMTNDFQFAALYDLRLKISQNYPIVHINELLYTEIEKDTRESGEKQFDYVDPKNRVVQIEMEKANTDHLKEIGAFLSPEFKQVDFNSSSFNHEASVIIPVRNRVKTVKDAITSVLMQKTSFDFNLIVIDNYSTDGTTDLIADIAKSDDRLIHVIPDRKDLGIGGCWNVGVQHEQCGKFSIQLDSDDIYASEDTLQKIVDAFYEQQCAMVIGSYTMTNFNMDIIPPGLIDHKEWTPENGRNNALRINGLGAPRAFYTPLLRKYKVPNTSYGEDYALGLRFSREYQIGRIYESLYLCRRWEDNSDAALDIAKINVYNTYKDKLRSIEIAARKELNA